MGAVVDALAAAFDWVVGSVPGRQPWRAIVMFVYFVGAFVGLGILLRLAIAAL